jgi:hypothetical protein
MANKRIIELPDYPGTSYNLYNVLTEVLSGASLPESSGKLVLEEFAIPPIISASDGDSVIYNYITSAYEWGKPIMGPPAGANGAVQVYSSAAEYGLSASEVLTWDEVNQMLDGMDELDVQYDNIWFGRIYYTDYANSSQYVYSMRIDGSSHAIFTRTNYLGATILWMVNPNTYGIQLCDSEDIDNPDLYMMFSKYGNIEHKLTSYEGGIQLSGPNAASTTVDGRHGFDDSSDGIVAKSTSATEGLAVVNIDQQEYDLVSTDFDVSVTVTTDLSASPDFSMHYNKNGEVTVNGSIIATSANNVISQGENYFVINTASARPNQLTFVVAPCAQTGYANADKPDLFLYFGITPDGDVYNPSTYSISRMWFDGITFQTNIKTLG